jgi:hypothetical protein
MKILGRTFIILFAFVLLSGLMVAAVNAAGINQPDFTGERTEFRPQGGEEGGLPFRPEGEHEDGERGERGAPGGFRWMFGAVKNVGIIAVLVAFIAWPRSAAKKKKRAVTTP